MTFITPLLHEVALLLKVTSSQLVMKFRAFYGTRTFTTAFTSARHLPLPWAWSIYTIPPIPFPEVPTKYYPPIYACVFRVVYFPNISPPKPRIHLTSPKRATCPAHLILLELITRITYREEYRPLSSSICGFLNSSVTSPLLGPNILLSILFSNTLSLWQRPSFTPIQNNRQNYSSVNLHLYISG